MLTEIKTVSKENPLIGMARKTAQQFKGRIGIVIVIDDKGSIISASWGETFAICQAAGKILDNIHDKVFSENEE